MNEKNLIQSILDLFTFKKVTLNLNEISKKLSIKSDTKEYQELKKQLNKLVQQNLLIKLPKRKYKLANDFIDTTFEGTIKIIKDNGVVETNNPNIPKIIIKRRHLNTALDGDKVLIKLLAQKQEKKPRGEVIKILERANRKIVGTIEQDGNFYFLIPDDERYYVDFLINPNKIKKAKHKDKVIAKFVKWNDPQKSPEAEVIEIIGKSDNFTTQFESIYYEFNLPTKFPESVLNEVSAIDTPKINTLLKTRLDLRDKLIITIDPEDAKDYDDALSLEILENKNYLLGVHIADVSFYVPEGSEIDKEAFKRGNSVYLVDNVIHMLPTELSTNICSLQPNRNRLTVSVFLEITPDGIVKKYDIYESIIKNKKRFNYNEVQKIIETGKGEYSELILNLHKLAQTLRQKRFQKGGIDFQTFEIKFKLDENKVPINAELRKTTYATMLVEECMLIANKTVAEHIKKLKKKFKLNQDLPFIYRIHDQPVAGKLVDILNLINSFKVIKNGSLLKLKPNQPISSKKINEILKKFENRPEKDVVHQLLIRSMAKAEYSHQNIGHYGLAFESYTHFTSPIRRYPDLIVHRYLKKYLFNNFNPKELKKINNFLEKVGEHCTETERLAMDAERASVKLAQTIISKKSIYKIFQGTISGITNFGLFVLLDDIYAEGFLHIRNLYDDYYIFDEPNFRLIGRKHKRIFQIGNKIKVKIVDVNIEKRRIDLALVE